MDNSDGFQVKFLSQDASEMEGGADIKVWTRLGPKLDASHSGEWFTFSAIFSFDNSIHESTGGGIKKRDIYFFGPPAGIDIYMDDLSIELLPALPAGPYISGDMGHNGEKVTLPEPLDPVGVLLGSNRISECFLFYCGPNRISPVWRQSLLC